MSDLRYDQQPFVEVPNTAGTCVVGWDAIVRRLRKAISARNSAKTVLVVDCYPGVDVTRLCEALQGRLTGCTMIDVRQMLLPESQIKTLVTPFTGGDDPVFGYMCNLTLPQWFGSDKVTALRRQINDIAAGVVVVVGTGAWHVIAGDLLVYANLTRREATLRFRRHEAGNLGVANQAAAENQLYKQAFFVDWRVADRWKRSLIDHWDFVLETNDAAAPKLAEGEAVRRGLRHTVTRPFRVVPYFDPAPWGGQWLREHFGLDGGPPNYGWGFDCVPEENSLRLGLGDVCIELPASDLVFYQPRQLLGESVHGRFGDEFPIRFDLLDTMRGGNLSLQVHPLTEYIQHQFGMHYTQDESYYILAAAADSHVILGMREDVDRLQMMRELRAAQCGDMPFDAQRYVNHWPAKVHDHFLIPAGTCHCSGANTVVLEISATPYIFTFKLWDWERLGLDGRPRPIHLDHGLANMQWDRTTTWCEQQLINCTTVTAEGEGWREERTGLHPREFIETRRHWFVAPVQHDTMGNLHVLNLVEGDEVQVVSPTDAFEPLTVHYAETFIVPARVGGYMIRPLEPSGRSYATIKAFVRS
ncbi:MAG: class I mannose-6-phosphate isomerase [Planctomycetales bacterium]|nr:class I mannose-6-phosphate isomerase [Planctomycetales bacterium]